MNARPVLEVVRAVALSALVGLLVSGCSGLSLDPLRVSLHNETDRMVMLFINDQWVGTYPPGSRVAGTPVVIPGPPWRLEARLSSGMVLAVADLPTLPSSGQSVGAAHTYDCGRVVLWGGDTQPPLPPPDFIDWAPPCT